MKSFFVVPAIILLPCISGCTIVRQVEAPDVQIELLRTAPLPPLTVSATHGGLRMNLLLHILADGSVDAARLMGSSGDPEWDSLALQTFTLWQFVPPKRGNLPTDVWARQLVVIQVQERQEMILGEIDTGTSEEADSLYGLILAGFDFARLAQKRLDALPAGERWVAERTDLATYPQALREVLTGLRVNDVTPPLRHGDRYVIIKRFDRQASGQTVIQ